MLKVVKRDGSIVDFDKGKIEVAINKAFLEVDGVINEDVSVEIAEKIEYLAKNSDSVFTVEDVQDIIEKQLRKYGCDDVARAYIKYR